MNQIVSLCVCASLKYFPLNLIYGSAKFAISSYFSRCCFSPGNIFFSPSSARFSLSNTFCATLCDTLQNYKCLHARYMLWLLLCYTQLAFCLFIYLSPMLNAPYLSQHHTKERCTKKAPTARSQRCFGSHVRCCICNCKCNWCCSCRCCHYRCRFRHFWIIIFFYYFCNFGIVLWLWLGVCAFLFIFLFRCILYVRVSSHNAFVEHENCERIFSLTLCVCLLLGFV